MAPTIVAEHFWLDKSRFDNAERDYYERLSEVRTAFCEEINILKDMAMQCWIDKSRFHIAERLYYEYVSKVNGVQDNELKMKSSSVRFDEQNIKHSRGVDIGEAAAHQQVAKTGKYNKSKKKLSKEVPETSSPCEVLFAKASKPLASETKAKVAKSRNKTKTNKKVADGTAPVYGQHTKSHTSYVGGLLSSKNQCAKGSSSISQCTLVSEIAKAREHIKNSLEKMDGIANLASTPISAEVIDRVASLEKDNADLKKLVKSLESIALESQQRISTLEGLLTKEQTSSSRPSADAKTTKVDEDDGVDLFASESEDENEDAARLREERLAAYAAKKSKKPALIAKSSLVLDVKPWDDETDLTIMETEIRKITADGLLWGASKFVPVAFGIKKISISCVVEDEKVSIDWLTEEIEKLEDYVQSVDVAAFNKI